MTDPVVRLNAALQGRYTIERELGEGGMATVYLADDLKHERKVALKVLKPRSELKVSVCGLKRLRSSRYMECEMVASRSPARADRQFRGIVKLRPTTVLDAQHGGFTAGSSPVSWRSID